MPRWEILSTTEVYRNPWIRVRHDKVVTHTGRQLDYGVVELNNPSVYIVATNERNEILMIQNYRYTIDKTIWEIPAGHSDGDDLLAAAKRELLEETGYESDEWEELGGLHAVIGIGNVPLVAFRAKNVRRKSARTDGQEDITSQRFMRLTDIEKMIKTEDFDDAPVLAVLYLAKIRGFR